MRAVALVVVVVVARAMAMARAVARAVARVAAAAQAGVWGGGGKIIDASDAFIVVVFIIVCRSARG